MKPYLERLSPDHGDELETLFLELFYIKQKKCGSKLKTPWFLDFVRLNIVAHRPQP